MEQAWQVSRGYRAIPRRLNLAREVIERPIAHGRAGEIAVRDAAGTLTFQELSDAVERFARGLGTLGIERGITFLIRAPNCRELFVAFLAGVKLGAIPILANSLLGIRELSHIVENGEPTIAIVRDEVAGPIRKLQGEQRVFRHVVVIGETGPGEVAFEEVFQDGEPVPTADTGKDDPAYMAYTSGTTGLPKGIVHAHRWVIGLGDLARLHMPLSAGDVVMHTSEVSFVWALGHGFLFPLSGGGSVAVWTGRPSPDRVLAAIEQFGVTVLATVPTLVRAILALPEVEHRYRLSSLRFVLASGEPLGEATYREWTRRFPCELYEVYGVSEFQVILANGPGVPVKPGSMGRAHPGMTVKVLDEGLREVGPGKIGSLAVRADDPGFFLEYRKQEEKWREAHRGTWYDTGDQVYQDEEGYFWYVGRQDDLFKSRGYLISPKEVEEAILEHPSVQEAAVVPEPDSEIGNKIKAFVVLRPSVAPPPVEEIRQKLRERIAPYKVPQIIEFVDGLPKSAVGKILRRALRQGAKSV